jgi:hypothetical protein
MAASTSKVSPSITRTIFGETGPSISSRAKRSAGDHCEKGSNCDEANRNIYSKINRSTVNFPVAEPSRISTAASTDFGRHFLELFVPAAFLGLGERTLCGWGKYLGKRLRSLGYCTFHIIIVG